MRFYDPDRDFDNHEHRYNTLNEVCVLPTAQQHCELGYKLSHFFLLCSALTLPFTQDPLFRINIKMIIINNLSTKLAFERKI